jgi:hypothetical protein
MPMYQTQPPDLHLDALGRELKPGMVAAHVSRKGSSIFIDPILILELLDHQYIRAWRISDRYEGEFWPKKRVFFFKEVTLQVPENLVIVEMKEQDLLERYHIAQQ